MGQQSTKNPQGKKSEGKQRMAGEVWREYDANAKGKEGFDNEDLKHLQGKGWSNNSIMQAAAASGNVHAGADVRLSKLNTETTDIYNIPDSVKDDMIERGGLGSYHAQLGAGYTFLGGDKKNMDNWHITGGANQGEDWKRRFGMIHHNNEEWEDAGAKNIDGYNYASSLKRGDSKEDRSVMTWQGINAEGGANALSGTYSKRGKDGEVGTGNLTWRLPPDFVASSRAKAAAPSQASSSDSSGYSPSASEATPAFDASAYSSRPPAAEQGESFKADTAPSMYDSWLSSQRTSDTSSSNSDERPSTNYSAVVDDGIGRLSLGDNDQHRFANSDRWRQQIDERLGVGSR